MDELLRATLLYLTATCCKFTAFVYNCEKIPSKQCASVKRPPWNLSLGVSSVQAASHCGLFQRIGLLKAVLQCGKRP